MSIILSNALVNDDGPLAQARLLRDHLRDEVNNAAYITQRLARTESARIAYTAQMNSYKEWGFTYVKWVSEPSACKYCLEIQNGGIDGEGVYKTDEVANIPVHPNCRCAVSAWYDPKELNDAIKTLQ